MIEKGIMIEIGMRGEIDSEIERGAEDFIRIGDPCILSEMGTKEEGHLNDLEGKAHRDDSGMAII